MKEEKKMEDTIKNLINHRSMSMDQYLNDYKKSIKDPESFWLEKAETLTWIKKFTKINESNFGKKVSVKWFSDGSLNVSYNCLDRHLKEKGEKTAIIWESDDLIYQKKFLIKNFTKMFVNSPMVYIPRCKKR